MVEGGFGGFADALEGFDLVGDVDAAAYLFD